MKTRFQSFGTRGLFQVARSNRSYEEVNVDAVVNGGVFLCMKPGYYYFSAALCAFRGDERIDVIIVHNSRETNINVSSSNKILITRVTTHQSKGTTMTELKAPRRTVQAIDMIENIDTDVALALTASKFFIVYK